MEDENEAKMLLKSEHGENEGMDVEMEMKEMERSKSQEEKEQTVKELSS